MAKKIARKKQLEKNEKYFNYGKKSYYIKDCCSFTYNFTKKKLVKEFIK